MRKNVGAAWIILRWVELISNSWGDLVWQGIRDNITDLSDIFWENVRTRELFREFRKVCRNPDCENHADVLLQSLYSPLVKKLGYDYSEADSADTKQLRSLAISGAASSEDPAQQVLSTLPVKLTYRQHQCPKGTQSKV